MAWTATGQGLTEAAGLMFVGSVLWIVAYDTMYAMVDRNDDLRIGVKSTAILFGHLDRLMIAILQVSTVFIWFLVGIALEFQHTYYAGLVICAAMFVHQQILIRKRKREDCFAAFRNNMWAGFSLFVGTVAEYFFRSLV